MVVRLEHLHPQMENTICLEQKDNATRLAKKVNKKVRKLAIRSALSAKAQNGGIIVIDAFELEKPKTKTIIDFSKKLPLLFWVNQ